MTITDQSWLVSAWVGRRGRCVRPAPGGCGGCSACSRQGGSHGTRTAPSQLGLGQPEGREEEGGGMGERSGSVWRASHPMW